MMSAQTRRFRLLLAVVCCLGVARPYCTPAVPVIRKAPTTSATFSLPRSSATPLLDSLVDDDAATTAVVASNQRRNLLNQPNRRSAVVSVAASLLGFYTAQLLAQSESVASAAMADCYTDCFKNCKILAPKDDAYCQESCRDYCAQPDRQDGLSGSISADKGEVGILGGSFGTGTVVKGQDKPPALSLPGLDFTSGSGKKLIGY